MTAAAYSNKGSTPVERQMVGDFTEAEMAEAIARQDELARRVNRACAEIGREVAIRRSFYPEWVRRRKITQAKADEQIGALVDAAALLRELSGVTR
jgi:hypothetical protein